MSRISTVYDRLLVELAALYPTKTRIPYAYDLIQNDDNFLRSGWGLKVGPASPTTLEWCKNAMERQFSVAIVSEVFNTGSNPVIYDDIAKGLLEDIYKAQDRFYEPDQIAIEGDIVKIDLVSISAVEPLQSEKLTFLSMEATFNFTVQEEI